MRVSPVLSTVAAASAFIASNLNTRSPVSNNNLQMSSGGSWNSRVEDLSELAHMKYVQILNAKYYNKMNLLAESLDPVMLNDCVTLNAFDCAMWWFSRSRIEQSDNNNSKFSTRRQKLASNMQRDKTVKHALLTAFISFQPYSDPTESEFAFENDELWDMYIDLLLFPLVKNELITAQVFSYILDRLMMRQLQLTEEVIEQVEMLFMFTRLHPQAGDFLEDLFKEDIILNFNNPEDSSRLSFVVDFLTSPHFVDQCSDGQVTKEHSRELFHIAVSWREFNGKIDTRKFE